MVWFNWALCSVFRCGTLFPSWVAGMTFRNSKMGPQAKPRSSSGEYGELVWAGRQADHPETCPGFCCRAEPPPESALARGWCPRVVGLRSCCVPPGTSLAPSRPSSSHPDCQLHISLLPTLLFLSVAATDVELQRSLLILPVIGQILWCADNSCCFERRCQPRQSRSKDARSHSQSEKLV